MASRKPERLCDLFFVEWHIRRAPSHLLEHFGGQTVVADERTNRSLVAGTKH
jgi:hypothetical protein